MIEVLNLSALVLRNCFRRLFQALILILFFGSIFILLGKQLYKGILTQKCVVLPPHNISDAEYTSYVSNSSNWLESKNGYYLCGNNTGSRSCPQNYTCLKGASVNTYVSNFNFYASSVVTISELMTLHFWEELYQKMLLTAGSLHVIYFVMAFYSFLYSSGLILAVITRSYKNVLRDFEIIEKNQPYLKRESASRCDLQKGVVKSPSCKSYELFTSQIIASDRIERQTSEILESSSRSTDKSFESDRVVKDSLSENRQKRETIISGLTSENANESVAEAHHRSSTFLYDVRRRLGRCISGQSAEVLCTLWLALFLSATVLQYSHFGVIPEELNRVIYYLFAGETLVEILVKLACHSPREYFKSRWNAFDCLVLVIGGTEMLLLHVEHPILFVLRSYKLVEVLVCCQTCTYLKHVTEHCLFLFRHPASILLVFITICVVTGMQLYGYEYFESPKRFPGQSPPRWYFRDLYSSFLLVFCMLCGDWKQPMVNAVLFTSCAGDLLMLVFVLVGNFVVINLFLGILFYTFFYKSIPRSCYSKDKLQNAIQVILKGQGKLAEPKAAKESSKIEEAHTSYSVSSEIVSETLASSSQTFKRSKRRKQVQHQCEEAGHEEEAGSSSEYMADCCPSLCYFCCGFCRAEENPVLWQNWADARCRLYCFVETRAFRAAVCLLILGSVASLIVDRSSYGGGAAPLVLDPCLFVLFLLEMVLKWMAYGLQKFFKSHLGRFEFCILLVYLVDLLSIDLFEGQKNIFKALRSFRLISLTPLLESYHETVPLPLKRGAAMSGESAASRESLLHLRQIECNHFLTRHCRYSNRPAGSGEIFQMEWNVPDVRPCDPGCVGRMRRIRPDRPHQDRPCAEAAGDCLPGACTPPCCRGIECCLRARGVAIRLLGSSACVVATSIAIALCCAMLAVEGTYPEGPPYLLRHAAIAIAALFVAELLLKLFALGLKRYLAEFWSLTECVATLAFSTHVLLEELGWKNWHVLKLLPAVRILYVCKIFNRNKQSQMVLGSLRRACPSHLVVLVFVGCLWLVFAVVGTALFSGKVRCSNGTLHFDTVAQSYVALLQVATLQNWMDFVTDIMDGSDKTNSARHQVYTALFFPLFILFSTFLTLYFFVGITCRCFNAIKRESEKGEGGSQSRRLYNVAVKKMEKIKLTKSIPPPRLPWQALLYRMVCSDNFEVAGFVLIGLHMLLIALDMYDPDPSEMFARAMTELNASFVAIFAAELALKVAALRQHWPRNPWNHFDLAVLALCVCGAYFEDLFPSPMLPAMLRLLRFLRCRRYLRRYCRGALPLLYSLRGSAPAFLALVALQFCVMTVYALFGVHLFRDAEGQEQQLSFQNFPRAMLLLFQLSTLAGWVEVLLSLGGGPAGAAFVVSYLVVVYYVVIRTHLLVLLDSFDGAMAEYENLPLAEDYEMFAEAWQRLDGGARGVLPFCRLPDLLDSLEEPLHFGRPNRFLIATLNIPLYEGDLVFWWDVMDALTRDFMGRRAHVLDASDAAPGLRSGEGKTLRKTGSSLWRQRQNYCASVIQRAWRSYAGKWSRSPVFYSEVRLASDSRGVDTFLTAQVRSGSHASV